MASFGFIWNDIFVNEMSNQQPLKHNIPDSKYQGYLGLWFENEILKSAAAEAQHSPDSKYQGYLGPQGALDEGM